MGGYSWGGSFGGMNGRALRRGGVEARSGRLMRYVVAFRSFLWNTLR
jgi:hypothetical protein